MLQRVDRIILRVSSLPGAVSYYRDTIGLKLLRFETHLAAFELAAGREKELILHDDPDLPAEATYYLVDDVRALHARRSELKLKFLTAPVRVARGWRAEVTDPFGNVLRLLDHATDSAHSEVIEDAKSSGSLFAGMEPKIVAKREALTGIYLKIARTADDLPYTPHFEALYNDYLVHFSTEKPSRHEVWRHLLNLRKGGKLPRLGDARSIPPEITEEERRELRRSLGSAIGKRDRLPYTPTFDGIVDHFNKSRSRPLSPHLIWRLVATLAK